jgi:hypothetical protein
MAAGKGDSTDFENKSSMCVFAIVRVFAIVPWKVKTNHVQVLCTEIYVIIVKYHLEINFNDLVIRILFFW